MALSQYATLYERLVANTELLVPDNPQSCWIWTGAVDKGYPRFTRRDPDKDHPVRVSATRAMLEEVLDIEFPFDEAGHLCNNSVCVNPDHLEVQTKTHNMAGRWGGQSRGEGSWIPVLFPREEEPCPF